MSDNIYNEDHVAVSRLLGREYNNPLGEAAFPLLKRLVCAPARPDILDAGCGRGQTACWWARQAGAWVDAFDPSGAMLTEANTRARALGVDRQIRFQQADIAGFHSSSRYDLAIVHDVLCYSPQRDADLLKLGALLKPGGVLSVSDYYRDGDSPKVSGVLAAWGIQPPLPFERPAKVLEGRGFRALFHFDTTRQYRHHWEGLSAVLKAKWSQIETSVGKAATVGFAAQIEAILDAVHTGEFGHCWTIWERQK